jgi:carotenoid cleavage dioxygenase
MATTLLSLANSLIDYTLPEGEASKTKTVVTGAFKPVAGNAHCLDLAITEGDLEGFPAGMYFRNGPNPMSAPKAQHHWFDGDGKMQAMKTDASGRVSYFSEQLQTPRLKQETEHGEEVRLPYVCC